MAGHLNLRSILDTNKLTGPNFIDWYRNVKIVLRSEKIAYVLDSPVPVALTEGQEGFDQLDAEATRQHLADNEQAVCILLASMSAELQRQHEHMDAPSIILHLQELYDKKGRAERFETSRELFGCKMVEGTAVGPHVLKMIGLIEKLASLGFIMDHELSVDLVLQSLPPSFNSFVVNYHMNKVETTLPELLSLLTTAEGAVKKNRTQALLIGGPGKAKGKGKSVETDKLKPKGKPKKKKGKGKDKGKEKSKDKANAVCFHCQKEGHWKRNCPLFLGSVKEKKHGDASTSGMFTIEINFSSVDSASWVLDTGCGSHICNVLQVLKNPRELRKNEVNLRVGNGARVAALAIGDVDLCLPTGFSLHLRNCFYVPSIFRNIISISALEQSGFHFIIKDGKFSIIMNDLVYACASRVNGLYVLDLESNSDILSIQAKRPRLDNRSYLWQWWRLCREKGREKEKKGRERAVEKN